MPVELTIPEVGESVAEALISQWYKKVGDAVSLDEPVAELETDKVTVELPAPAAGVLVSITMPAGSTAAVGDVIGMIDDQAVAQASPTEPVAASAQAPPPAGEATAPADIPVTPAARRLLAQHGLDASQVPATGKGGRLLKEDVLRFVEQQSKRPATPPTRPPVEPQPATPIGSGAGGTREEEIVAMSPIRRRIAERLVEAQQSAALLTTFNEIDMSAVKDLRRQYRESFEQRHGVRLGFMSFFVKAAIDALRQFPQVNAEVRGTDLVYRNYYDIGIAVSTDRGLLVPVLRNAERLGFGEIEVAIGDFAARARSSKIRLDELEGGTFTITNGGIFGSMLSTPIVNPPQSGVLGLHAIEDRPVAHNGEIVIRPMMYVALTYDHRIVDGREAVTFLRRIKEAIEDPSRMLLEV